MSTQEQADALRSELVNDPANIRAPADFIPKDGGEILAWTTYETERLMGVPGAVGRWKYSASTVDADPGVGFFAFNNADPTLATELYISTTGSDFTDYTETFPTFIRIGDLITISDRNVATRANTYQVTATVDVGTYTRATIVHLGAAATPTYIVGAECGLIATAVDSPAGATGAWRFIDGNADADPGLGNMTFNNPDATLTTVLYISKQSVSGDEQPLPLVMFEGDTLIISDPDDPVRTISYRIDDNFIDGGTYWKLPVEYISDLGTPSFLDGTIVALYIRVGIRVDAMTGQAQWRYDTSTVDAAPAAGYFRLNNATPSLATFAYIAWETADALNYEHILATFLARTNRFMVQQANDDERVIDYRITDDAEQLVGYVRVPLELFFGTGPNPVLVADQRCALISLGRNEDTTSPGSWDYDTAIDTGVDPGLNDFRLNNATATAVTVIAFDNVSHETDWTTGLDSAIRAGDLLRITQDDSTSRWMQFHVQADPVSQGGWWTVDVLWDSEGAIPVFQANRTCSVISRPGSPIVTVQNVSDFRIPPGGFVLQHDMVIADGTTVYIKDGGTLLLL